VRQRWTVAALKKMGVKVPKLTPLAVEMMAAERTKWEDALGYELARLGLRFTREFVFDGTRKWRADFAFVDARILVEVDGGTHLARSSHGRGGYEKDRRRDMAAALLGWRVVRVTPGMVKDHSAATGIRELVEKSLTAGK
jgi:very-short-patch-repair endonuclease